MRIQAYTQPHRGIRLTKLSEREIFMQLGGSVTSRHTMKTYRLAQVYIYWKQKSNRRIKLV